MVTKPPASRQGTRYHNRSAAVRMKEKAMQITINVDADTLELVKSALEVGLEGYEAGLTDAEADAKRDTIDAAWSIQDLLNSYWETRELDDGAGSVTTHENSGDW